MAKSKSTSFKTKKFSSSHLLIVALIFGLVGGIISWAAFAAPTIKDNGNGTISAPIMVTDKNGDGLPNQGDTITFNISTTETNYPVVVVKCLQNGVLVAQGWGAWYLDPSYRNFTLASAGWPSGTAADCSAQLQNRDSFSKNGKIAGIASTTFHVNP